MTTKKASGRAASATSRRTASGARATTSGKAKVTGKRAPARKPGRPSKYTDSLAARIADLYAEGYSLRGIEAMAGMPSKATLSRWMAREPAFCDHLARAREVRAMMRIERVDEHLEDLRDGTLDPKAARVLIRGEMDQAAMEAPKRYGAKIAVEGHHEHSGRIEHDAAGRVSKILELALKARVSSAGSSAHGGTTAPAAVELPGVHSHGAGTGGDETGGGA